MSAISYKQKKSRLWDSATLILLRPWPSFIPKSGEYTHEERCHSQTQIRHSQIRICQGSTLGGTPKIVDFSSGEYTHEERCHSQTQIRHSQIRIRHGSTLGGSPKIVDFSHLGAPDELRVDRYRDQQLATSSIDPSIARHPISSAQTSKTSKFAFESRVSRYERTNRENQDPSHLRE